MADFKAYTRHRGPPKAYTRDPLSTRPKLIHKSILDPTLEDNTRIKRENLLQQCYSDAFGPVHSCQFVTAYILVVIQHTTQRERRINTHKHIRTRNTGVKLPSRENTVSFSSSEKICVLWADAVKTTYAQTVCILVRFESVIWSG